MIPTRALAAAGALALVLGAGACGSDDDGAAVREIGAEDCPSGSGSATGSASASAPASGAAAASGSASAPASGAAAASGSASAPASGSASEECPSGSGSGSASGAAPASGSASASEVACETVGDPASAETTVAATLDEFTISLAQRTAPAGSVAFRAINEGEEPHEIVVARIGLDDIPVVDGIPDEEALGEALIGEIEAFPAGETCEGQFELEAGDYTLFCAIVETEADGTVEGHFAEGMATTFTVE